MGCGSVGPGRRPEAYESDGGDSDGQGAALEGGWCEAPPYLARAAETLLEANLMRKEARHSRQTQPPESSYFSCLMFFSPVCKAAEGERHTTAQMES